MIDIQRIRSNIRQHYKKQKEDKEQEHAANNAYSKYYQDQRWKNLRSWYRTIKPCCEVCERMGYIVPATQTHHLHPFSYGLTEEAKWNLLLNPDNLCSVCDKHHKLFHRYMKQYGTDIATIDEIIQYDKDLNKYSK